MKNSHDMRQASAGGEINVPLAKGLFQIDEVYATLREIVAGQKQGGKDRKAVTIFDSTGLAIDDIAVAKLIYSKAKQSGNYLSLDFVEVVEG